MTLMAWPSVASEDGVRPRTRMAESPRPMPHTVRLPNMSFSGANRRGGHDRRRDGGVGALGPALAVGGRGKIREENDKGSLPQHAGVERPDVAEPAEVRAGSQLGHPAPWRVGLQHQADIHQSPPISGTGIHRGAGTGPAPPGPATVRR